MKALEINDRLRALVAQPNEEEMQAMLADLQEHGWRRPLAVWRREGEMDVILSDIHLYQASLDADIIVKPSTHPVEGIEDLDDACLYAVREAVIRQHLNPWQRFHTVWGLRDQIRAKAKKRQATRSQLWSALSEAGDDPVHTMTVIAQMAGVGETTAKMCQFIMRMHCAGEISDTYLKELNDGKRSVSGACNELKARRPENSSGGSEEASSAKGTKPKSGSKPSLGQWTEADEIPWDDYDEDESIIAEKVEALIYKLHGRFADYDCKSEIKFVIRVDVEGIAANYGREEVK